ncbi:MAG TPA: hypothetical protein VFV71_13315 [Burkholderiales bacterium]|nr:hypothetical protein [Burkholderiales bacterium]
MKRQAGAARRAALAVMLAAAAPAVAMNLMGLGDVPLRHMTGEDTRILMDTAEATLETGADGVMRAWSNPLTSAHGELTPGPAFERGGRRCRDLEVYSSAGGRDNRLTVTTCKGDDGEWRVDRP